MKHQYIDWFESYLKSQCVRYLEGITSTEDIKCGAPQGSIQGPLVFIFVHDLQHVTKFRDPIMFADDSNLFYSNSNIKKLFVSINKEQVNFIDWCFDNKLSIKNKQNKIYMFL